MISVSPRVKSISSPKEMIEDSEEISAALKQQISVFSRLVAWVNSRLVNTVAAMTSSYSFHVKKNAKTRDIAIRNN